MCVRCEVFGHVGTVAYQRLPVLCDGQWLPSACPCPKALKARRQVASPAHGSMCFCPAAQVAAYSSVEQSAEAQPQCWAEGRKKAWGAWGQNNYWYKEQFPQLYWVPWKKCLLCKTFSSPKMTIKLLKMLSCIFISLFSQFLHLDNKRKEWHQWRPPTLSRYYVFGGAWIFKVNTGCAGKSGDCRGKASMFHEGNDLPDCYV